MDIKLKIGARIKESRKNKNISGVQLADMTGFSAQRISNWERGVRTPKLKDAEILGQALDVSPTWLLHLDIDRPSNSKNFRTIPIINSLQIEENLPIPLSIQNDIHEGDFSFIVHDKSMFPTYNIGDIVTFSKENHGCSDLALINIPATNEFLFRTVSFCDGIFTFLPSNSAWPIVRFEDKSMFKIVGWLKNGSKVIY